MLLSLVLSLAGASLAAAQSPDAASSPDDLPGGGWYTGVQLQNVGTAGANFTITAYSSTSTATFTKASSAPIPQNGSQTFLPADMNIGGAAFQGSAVVSSDQALNSIVNITNRAISVGTVSYGIAGGLAAAQYQGVNKPATTLSFPLVKRNHFGKTTTFSIQNAGSVAATATATFTVGGGVFKFTTPAIEPNRMFILNPSAAGVPSGNGVSLGSLTVSSSQLLAGTVTEHDSTESGVTLALALQATRGFTQGDYDVKTFAPIIKSEFFNRFTGLQVQNVSSGPVDMTVTYKGGGGTCVGQTFTSKATAVPAGASHTFVHLTSDATNPMPKGCLASATVEATGNVVGVVNEAFVPAFISSGGNGGRQELTAYSCAAAKSATAKLSAPLYKEKSFNKGTGLQVQNVGAAAATNVVATFVSPAGSFTTKPQTIPAGGAFTFTELFKHPELFTTPIPATISGANGVFGVVVTADQSIVAIANESPYPFTAPAIQQDKNNYEAFNQ